jgi:hypothetical protein
LQPPVTRAELGGIVGKKIFRDGLGIVHGEVLLLGIEFGRPLFDQNHPLHFPTTEIRLDLLEVAELSTQS